VFSKLACKHLRWPIFAKLTRLIDNARYSLARLVLRKPNQWHAISSLDKYKQEIGEDGLLHAIQDLCKPFSVLMMKSEPCDTTTRNPIPKTEILDQNVPMDIKKEDGLEVIDLTFDTDDDEDVKPNTALLNQSTFATYWANKASGSKLPLPPAAGAPHVQEDPIQALLRSNPADEVPLDFFCEDETTMSLPEILERLNKEQLMKLVKVMKCTLKTGQSRVWSFVFQFMNKIQRIFLESGLDTLSVMQCSHAKCAQFYHYAKGERKE